MNENVKFLLTGYYIELYPSNCIQGSQYLPIVLAYRLLNNHIMIELFKETDNLNYTYKNKLDKACFAHDAAYVAYDGNDLIKRTISDKVLKDSVDEAALNGKYNRYKKRIASMVYKFSDKKLGSGGITTSKASVNVNEVLAQGFHKPVIKKLKRRKSYGRFKDNILATDLAEMESLSTKNCDIKYILCVTDVFAKYSWV